MKRFSNHDDGFAMVVVMAVIAVVTVVAIGGFALSQQVLAESSRVLNETKAFQVAQSGLDREIAQFDTADVSGGGTYTKTGSTPDGTYEITGSQVSTFEYEITSEGTAEGRTEGVTQRFFKFNLWDMNIGAGQSSPLGGGRGFNGNAAIYGPLYIRGDFDFDQANAVYEGGPLMVKGGDVIVGGSATIGYADPIDLFLDGSITGVKPSSCYYKSWSTSVPDIELPWLDDNFLDTRLNRALEESTDNFMGYASSAIVNTETIAGVASTYGDGSTIPGRIYAPSSPASGSDHYKFIGNGTSRASLGDGSYFMEIDGVSFGAGEGNGYPAASGLHDDFAYDAGTGTMYVEGAVFIDGDLHIGTNVSNYKGNGTIVVNGDVFIGGEVEPVGGDMSAENCVSLAVVGDVTIGDNAHSGNTRARWEGAIFCNGEVSLYHTATSFEGSILCDTLYGDKPDIEIRTNPDLPNFLPPDMPAIDGQTYLGAWSRN